MLNKKYLTLITRERKSFWQLRQLDDFTINAVSNLSVHERLNISEAYSESIRTSKMELFGKMVNG